MASIKATLTVALKANHVVVAELEDPGLWQRVLAALKLGDSATLEPPSLPLPTARNSLTGANR